MIDGKVTGEKRERSKERQNREECMSKDRKSRSRKKKGRERNKRRLQNLVKDEASDGVGDAKVIK